MTEYRFRTKIGYNTFNNKYAGADGESWPERARIIVDDVCGTRGGTTHPLMSHGDRDQLVDYITKMWFMPGGRYIYYSGRAAKFYNNCFDGDTKLMTNRGMMPMREMYKHQKERAITVLSPVDGKFKAAEMIKHPEQPVNLITFVPVRGRSNIEFQVVATPNHRWPLAGGGLTHDIRVGDTVPAGNVNLAGDNDGFLHGFMFGDGNAHGQLRLCGAKRGHLTQLLKASPTKVTYPPFAGGDPVVYAGGETRWKEFPSEGNSPAYIASFIEGWLAAAADSCYGRQLSCVKRDHLMWFREHAVYAGLVVAGDLRSQVRGVILGGKLYKDHELFLQNYSRGDKWQGFKVKAIVPAGEQEVYCPREPEFERIVINHNIDTYQCYLFKALEDTREEWARLNGSHMNALMTGGGIGTDYSVLRRAGAVLKRTGGLSSGPLPLMHATNEVGRNVMQGGSRRSAVYASLAREHADIWDFLRAKNWDEMPVGATGKTLWNIKQDDFNFPAPLDMTNISVNYGDEWLGLKDRHLDPVFHANVAQALRTGEPGFSFNFGDDSNETLRNACTEVTSEDDSDVCNLGSVNMGPIPDKETFKDVLHLASKFLICGTLRAELPNEVIRQTRERNRRIGVGLMGMHEWLLRRDQRYAVVPEMHDWLKVYKSETEKAANEHCDRFYISRPVKYRAIAPTGTIGILAGTTTGIEPLYAVAYKRRYLTGGTKWKYEFVVDATADYLIRECGAKPESISTALSLAEDPGARLHFQSQVQRYVDHAISSTINLPAWGGEHNCEGKVDSFAKLLAEHAPHIRGFTCYPDGARGGQPLTAVPYEEAIKHKGVVFDEVDVCEITGHGGTCGV